MEFIDSSKFTADAAWGSRLLFDLGNHTVKIHWTDRPYRWHQNTGRELFAVLDGAVDMHYIEAGEERSRTLTAGQMMLFDDGDSHVAHPIGEARILVVEQKGTD